MKSLQVKGGVKVKGGTFFVDLPLVHFVEDNIHIIYCPSFDLSGYGETEKEAKNSFGITVDAFINYTHAKNTLHTVLINLGWKIKSGRLPQFTPPLEDDLKAKNELFNEIITTKQYTQYTEKFELAF